MKMTDDREKRDVSIGTLKIQGQSFVDVLATAQVDWSEIVDEFSGRTGTMLSRRKRESLINYFVENQSEFIVMDVEV